MESESQLAATSPHMSPAQYTLYMEIYMYRVSEKSRIIGEILISVMIKKTPIVKHHDALQVYNRQTRQSITAQNSETRLQV